MSEEKKEGELYRKLAKDKGISTLGNSYIKEVLDEANADYPEWQKPAHAEGQYPNSAELTQALISHSMKVSAWKKKWFGSAESLKEGEAEK
jgi:hypothetical protein